MATTTATTAAARAAANRSGADGSRGTRPRPSARGRAVSGSAQAHSANGSPHRRRVARPAAPKAPRRVSGPAPRSGRLLGNGIVMSGGAVALPQPSFAPPARERVAPRRGRTAAPSRERIPAPSRERPDAPSRERIARPRRSAPAQVDRSLAAGALGVIRALPDLPLLDRILRGRTWIALLGVMLAGIVYTQVEVLRLGAKIGTSIEQSSTLQATNEQLRVNVATLSNVQRIEQLAETMGMVLPPPTAVGFVSGGAGELQAALNNIKPPSPSAVGTQATTNGGLTTGAGMTTAKSPAQG
jgi:cell division protein FtsL